MLATFFVMLVIFSMYKIGHQHPDSVTNISNLSPTHLISNIRHQHRCNHSGNFKSLIERVSFLVYSAHVWRVKKFDSLVRLISFFTFVSGRKSLEIENSNSWHYHRSFLITSLTLVYLLYDSTQTILPYISEQYLHLWQILTLS